MTRHGGARCSELPARPSLFGADELRRCGAPARRVVKIGDVDSDMWAPLCHVCENHPRNHQGV
jgi:hypothetical protein